MDDDRFDALLREQTGAEAAPAADYAASDDDLAALAEDAAAVDDLLDSRDDAPVVRLINALLLEAIRDGASDIHIETEEKRLVVRFRIDGVLREVLEPEPRAWPRCWSAASRSWRGSTSPRSACPHDGRVTPAHRRPGRRRPRLDHPVPARRARRPAPARPRLDLARPRPARA